MNANLFVTSSKVMICECFEKPRWNLHDCRGVFTSDHQMSFVKLHINFRIFCKFVFHSTGRCQSNQFPKVTFEFMTANCLFVFFIYFSLKILVLTFDKNFMILYFEFIKLKKPKDSQKYIDHKRKISILSLLIFYLSFT